MKVVLFTTNSARILEDPKMASEMIRWQNVVFDPNLSLVNGLLPQFWKLDSGRIVPMTPKEIRYRKKLIEKEGIDNQIRPLALTEITPSMQELSIIQALEKEYNQLKWSHWLMVSLNVLSFLGVIYLVSRL